MGDGCGQVWVIGVDAGVEVWRNDSAPKITSPMGMDALMQKTCEPVYCFECMGFYSKSQGFNGMHGYTDFDFSKPKPTHNLKSITALLSCWFGLSGAYL